MVTVVSFVRASSGCITSTVAGLCVSLNLKLMTAVVLRSSVQLRHYPEEVTACPARPVLRDSKHPALWVQTPAEFLRPNWTGSKA